MQGSQAVWKPNVLRPPAKAPYPYPAAGASKPEDMHAAGVTAVLPDGPDSMRPRNRGPKMLSPAPGPWASRHAAANSAASSRKRGREQAMGCWCVWMAGAKLLVAERGNCPEGWVLGFWRLGLAVVLVSNKSMPRWCTEKFRRCRALESEAGATAGPPLDPPPQPQPLPSVRQRVGVGLPARESGGYAPRLHQQDRQMPLLVPALPLAFPGITTCGWGWLGGEDVQGCRGCGRAVRDLLHHLVPRNCPAWTFAEILAQPRLARSVVGDGPALGW